MASVQGRWQGKAAMGAATNGIWTQWLQPKASAATGFSQGAAECQGLCCATERCMADPSPEFVCIGTCTRRALAHGKRLQTASARRPQALADGKDELFDAHVSFGAAWLTCRPLVIQQRSPRTALHLDVDRLLDRLLLMELLFEEMFHRRRHGRQAGGRAGSIPR